MDWYWLGNGVLTRTVVGTVPRQWREGLIKESVESLCRDGADTPIGLNIQNPSKLLNAHILSLHRHVTLVLERFCSQKYP